MIVRIHADESCLGNGKEGDTPGGAGGLVEVERGGVVHRRDYWISEPNTTNNRMAIRSAIEALRNLTRPCSIEFISDSQYLVKGMSEWMTGWIRKGKLQNGRVANAALWNELLEVAEPHRITWLWTRGHVGTEKNEYADHLATRAAREQTQSGGLVESGYDAWRETQLAKAARRASRTMQA